MVENKFQTKIGTLFSNNGGEYIALRDFLRQHGITHLPSPPHTPQHNGLSERKHRHIVETGLTLLSTASIPKDYWTYAFSAAVYLINRLPTPILEMQSPFSKIFGTIPNYTKLRVFGCLCFPWLRPYNSNKLEHRSTRCVFLGHSTTQSAYYCMDQTTGRIYTARHVKFDETVFPFEKTSTEKLSEVHDSTPLSTSMFTPVTPQSSAAQGHPSLDLHPPQPPTTRSSSSPQVLPSHSSNPPVSSPLEPTALSQNEPTPMAQLNPTSVEPTAQEKNELQPPTQPTQPPNTNPTSSTRSNQPMLPQNPQTQQTENIHKMQTIAKNKISKPIQKLTLSVVGRKNPKTEPTTISQAMKDEKWRGAATAEFDAHIKNHTWDLKPNVHGHNIIGCRWLFTTKNLANGQQEHPKGRLVAKGYTQQHGIDYSETFSPVIKSTTIRLVLQIVVTKAWHIKQLDINNAFLQGELTEVVYMMKPPGFIDKDRPDHVCRLRKPIYGLKQAPCSWYLSLKQHLLHTGFVNSNADASLLIHLHGSNITYVLVYVDDILVTGNNPTIISQVLTAFANRFSIKDPVDLHYFLGIEATRTRQGLHLMQRKYITDLLHKNNMTDAKPVATPLPTSRKLTLQSGTPLEDGSQYRSVVGSLQYMAFTRPDISYAVTRLSQFMHKPTIDHCQAAKRVLRYLSGTRSHGIFLHHNSPLSLHAFSDADWAGDTNDFVSMNGYIIYLGKNPISWSSKKQKGVARSSTEAEYRAVANTAAEVTWLCSLLSDLQQHLYIPPVIYCDNVGATYL